MEAEEARGAMAEIASKKAQAEPKPVEAPPAPEAEEPPAETKTGVIELDKDEIMSLRVVLLERQKCRMAEELAAVRLKEAQRDLMAAVRNEAIAAARIANRHNLGRVKGIRVVGPDKLAYELE